MHDSGLTLERDEEEGEEEKPVHSGPDMTCMVTFMHYTVCMIKMINNTYISHNVYPLSWLTQITHHHTNHWQDIIGRPSSHTVCYYNRCNCVITAHVSFEHVCTTPGLLLQHTPGCFCVLFQHTTFYSAHATRACFIKLFRYCSMCLPDAVNCLLWWAGCRGTCRGGWPLN